MCQSLSLQVSMLTTVFETSQYGDSLAKKLAAACGVSIALVYQWTDGSKTMSPDYLPTLYAITNDSRVYTMLMPVGSVFVPPAGDPAQKDVLRLAVVAVRESAEAQAAILNGMEDNLLEFDELENIRRESGEAKAAHAAVEQAAEKRMEAVTCTA